MRSLVFAAAVSLTFSCAFAQNPTTDSASDPQAVSLAKQSVAVLTDGVAISDVTLTGEVTSTVGSESEHGTGTFIAKGTGESRIDLILPSGTRTEISDLQTGSLKGQWRHGDENARDVASRNCATDAVWFFPALTSLIGRADRKLKYIGQETRNGIAVQHIRSYKFDGTLPQTVQSRYEAFTAVDFYLDTDTLVPVALSFSVHPDDGSDVDLPADVEFSNYQKIRGISVPMKISKYIQGNLLLDFSVSTVAFNSGMSNATFAIQSAQAGK